MHQWEARLSRRWVSQRTPSIISIFHREFFEKRFRSFISDYLGKERENMALWYRGLIGILPASLPILGDKRCRSRKFRFVFFRASFINSLSSHHSARKVRILEAFLDQSSPSPLEDDTIVLPFPARKRRATRRSLRFGQSNDEVINGAEDGCRVAGGSMANEYPADDCLVSEHVETFDIHSTPLDVLLRPRVYPLSPNPAKAPPRSSPLNVVRALT